MDPATYVFIGVGIVFLIALIVVAIREYRHRIISDWIEAMTQH